MSRIIDPVGRMIGTAAGAIIGAKIGASECNAVSPVKTESESVVRRVARWFGNLTAGIRRKKD